MKYLIVLFVFFFTGCVGIDDLTNTFHDLTKAPVYSELHLYDPGLLFSSIEEVGMWIGQNIKYSAGFSYAQEPKETLVKGTGDCKADAVLFMDLLFFSMGIKSNLICVEQSEMTREVVEGGNTDHCMVEVNGVIYEPQNGLVYTGPIGYRYSFNHVFSGSL